MNPNAYRDYQFVKGGDFDTPATIIEAVGEWQEATEWRDERELTEVELRLRALRLPPVEEARRD